MSSEQRYRSQSLLYKQSWQRELHGEPVPPIDRVSKGNLQGVGPVGASFVAASQAPLAGVWKSPVSAS